MKKLEAKELRIGNILRCPKGNYGAEFVKVESISDEGINLMFRDYALRDLEPIPLTEEILLKCGFEKEFKFSFTRGSIRIELGVFDKWAFFWNTNSDESIFICEVQYLHSVQNIVYELTKEELEVNFDNS